MIEQALNTVQSAPIAYSRITRTPIRQSEQLNGVIGSYDPYRGITVPNKKSLKDSGLIKHESIHALMGADPIKQYFTDFLTEDEIKKIGHAYRDSDPFVAYREGAAVANDTKMNMSPADRYALISKYANDLYAKDSKRGDKFIRLLDEFFKSKKR
jgi:hypothetical protein